MSNLDDFLGGGGGGGGGGGVPLGGLIETTKFTPQLTNYRKVNQTQILTQAAFPDLYAELGLFPDTAPQFSAAANQNDFNGELDHTINEWVLILDDQTNWGHPDQLYNANGDLWFAWIGAVLWYSSDGLEGTWAQATGFSEASANGVAHKHMAWGAGYMVCISDRHVLCNQTAHDYTSWTEYDLNNGSEYLRTLHYGDDGYWFIGWIHDFSNANACASWTDDPRFAANWQDHLYFFSFGGEQAHAVTSRGTMTSFYNASQGCHVCMVGFNHWSSDYNKMEMWYTADPANDTQLTEITDFTTEHNNTPTTQNLIFGPDWETANGNHHMMITYGGIDYLYVWEDVTASQTRKVNVEGDTYFAYSQQMKPLNIPELGLNGGVWNYQGVLYTYHWDGSKFNSGRSDEFKMYYDGAELNWSTYGDARHTIDWDATNKNLVLMAKPDTTQTGDYYLWKYPFYTYDRATEFGIKSITHDDSEVVYQMRVV